MFKFICWFIVQTPAIEVKDKKYSPPFVMTRGTVISTDLTESSKFLEHFDDVKRDDTSVM